jgi:HEAT repeat protein
MLNHEHFAITLARTVELFRTRPEAIPDQKAALRALVALTQLGGATVHVGDGALVVEGTVVPSTLPAIGSLAGRLERLGVSEVQIARNASPAELLALVRALASDSTAEDAGSVARRLRESGAQRISVLAAGAEEVAVGARPMRVTEAFVAAGLLDEDAGDAGDVLGATDTSAEHEDSLIRQLLEATTIEQRLARFEALRQSERRVEAVLALLEHQDVSVVRTVAELAGELRLEAAAERLGRLLSRSETEVRQVAATALARIDTPEAAALVRRALEDADTDVRLAVAAAGGDLSPSALAAALASAAESERNTEVKCAYYHALGRMGTTEALEALVKAVQPGGRFLGRKSAPPRIAAVEALRDMSGPVALGTLEWLQQDSNKDVRAAVRRALKQMRATSA